MLRRLSEPSTFNAALFLTIASACWGGNFIVGRAVVGHVPPVTLAFIRWGGAALIILPFAWRHIRKDWPLVGANLPILLFLGLTGSGVFNTLQYVGLTYTTATSAAVLNSGVPIFVPLACLALLGERISLVQALGIAISFLGVLVVVAKGDLGVLAAMQFNRGDMLILAGMAIWSLYAAYFRRRPPMHLLSFSAVSFAIAGLFNLPLAAAEMLAGARPELSARSLAACLYVAVFPSVVAYLLMNRGMEIVGPTRAGAFQHLVPLFAAVLAILVLGERPELHHLVGFPLILAGVTIAARKP